MSNLIFAHAHDHAVFNLTRVRDEGRRDDSAPAVSRRRTHHPEAATSLSRPGH